MLSKTALLISIIVLLFTSFIFHPRWEQPRVNATISFDVCGYYWYLPSAFIYKDIKQQKFSKKIIEKYYPLPQRPSFEDKSSGNLVNTYTVGMAVMYSPFFTAAHIIAKPLGYPADGFSVPYQLAIQIYAVIMALIGIWYYRKFLLRYFSDKVTAIMLLLLVVGTNYLNYTAIDGGQTHNALFTLYALLLLNTSNFYKNPTRKYAIKIGVLIGLALLIRPTEIISILIPLLWGLDALTKGSVIQRLKFFKEHKKYLVVASIIVVAIGSMQVFYWLYVTGKPLIYSYEEKGFSWFMPHFYNYMLSYRSGWLTYTPLMIFSFIGVYYFVKYGQNKVMVLSFFAVSLYITSAWDIWWYGGTGGRAMIQSYPVILLPFATFVEQMLKTKIKWIATPFLILFAYVNVWFTYSAHAKGGLYDPNGMTKSYYWHVVGQFDVPEHTQRYKDTDEYYEGNPTDLELIYENDLEQDSLELAPEIINGHHSIYIDGNRTYAAMKTIAFKNSQNADWVRATINVKPLDKEWEAWKMVQYTVNIVNQAENVKYNAIRINRYAEPGGVTQVYFDTKIPRDDFDSLKIFLWNPGSDKPIIVDDIKVYTFKEQ